MYLLILPAVFAVGGLVIHLYFVNDAAAGLKKYGDIYAILYETGVPLWVFGLAFGTALTLFFALCSWLSNLKDKW